jgi:hypothetical protein
MPTYKSTIHVSITITSTTKPIKQDAKDALEQLQSRIEQAVMHAGPALPLHTHERGFIENASRCNLDPKNAWVDTDVTPAIHVPITVTGQTRPDRKYIEDALAKLASAVLDMTKVKVDEFEEVKS